MSGGRGARDPSAPARSGTQMISPSSIASQAPSRCRSCGPAEEPARQGWPGTAPGLETPCGAKARPVDRQPAAHTLGVDIITGIVAVAFAAAIIGYAPTGAVTHARTPKRVPDTSGIPGCWPGTRKAGRATGHRTPVPCSTGT